MCKIFKIEYLEHKRRLILVRIVFFLFATKKNILNMYICREILYEIIYIKTF